MIHAAYHAMCRFNSGFVWQHPLLQGIRYYWRVEPGAARTKSVGMVEYHCDMQDLFRQTRLEKKQYGFVIAFEEDVRTISKLWDHVKGKCCKSML
jgi:alpha 1,2-mannosyltransferase